MDPYSKCFAFCIIMMGVCLFGFSIALFIILVIKINFYPSDTDECASTPCLNGATCVDLVNMYQCDCVPGFNGTDCDNGKIGLWGKLVCGGGRGEG